ncbi:MAG: SpoIIE family protein phosphatase [Candidatus Sumerlaeia bacterium]
MSIVEKACILIVDDNQLNIELLTQELEDLNCIILTAQSGHEALQIVEQRLPDLVLLDWMMPGMSGLELLEHWRQDERTKNMPVIMVTAKSASEDVVQCLRAGANDYVTKPLDLEILQARVDTHLRLHFMREELRLKNEQLQRELEAARRMQLASLPDAEEVRRVSHAYSLTCAFYYEATNQLAGDYWDILDQHDQLTFVIVDFAGHGVVPSINTFRFKTFLHSQCLDVKDPARILTMANDYFCRQLTEYDYATVAVCSIVKGGGRGAGRMIYANAGHPPPLLLKPQGGQIIELPKGSFPIGLIPQVQYQSSELSTASGDMLFFYTDGLVEIWNAEGQMFGIGNLFNFLCDIRTKDVDSLVKAVVDRVKSYRGGEPLSDDITTLAVQFL